MRHTCNRHIREAFELVKNMIILSDSGEAHCRDNGCALLYGVIRDSAYRIKKEAERERDSHIEKGIWEEQTEKTYSKGKSDE